MREQTNDSRRSFLGAIDSWFEAHADRALRAAAVLLVLGIVGFAVYYYFDRYHSTNNVTIIDQGVTRLEEMIKRDPRNGDARVQLGFGYAELGYVDEAIVQYNEALKIDEKNQGALIGLGHAYMDKQNPDKAVTYYLQVAELNKNNPYRKTLRILESVYYNLATIHFERGNLDETLQYVREALDIERTDADAHLLLGRALQGKGDHDGAVAAFRDATRMDPNFADAYHAMVKSFEAKGLRGHVLYAQGMAAYSAKDFDGALKRLKEAVAATPNLAEAYLGIGLSHERLGQKQEAMAAYGKAVEIDPELALAQSGIKRLQRQ